MPPKSSSSAVRANKKAIKATGPCPSEDDLARNRAKLRAQRQKKAKKVTNSRNRQSATADDNDSDDDTDAAGTFGRHFSFGLRRLALQKAEAQKKINEAKEAENAKKVWDIEKADGMEMGEDMKRVDEAMGKIEIK